MSNDIKLTLKDIYRAHDVFRWQIVKTIRHQSLAEHSFMVTMITAKLCQVMGVNDEVHNAALRYALVHDLPEVVTGDMATPLKRLIGPAARARLNEFESRVKVFDDWSIHGGGQPDVVRDIVKMADMIEAAAFLSLNAASDHGVQICNRIIAELSKNTHADRVLAEILYSADVTLDSLGI